MSELLTSIEHTRIALTVRDSLPITATLSALHLFGVTLVGGGALISGLRALGVLMRDRPRATILRPAVRAILGGLLIAIPTGLLLVAPRAHSAYMNGFFRWKMLSLLIVLVVHLFVYRRVTADRREVPGVVSVVGSAAVFSVIVAGGAFILLE
jgi:hypothetical protein